MSSLLGDLNILWAALPALLPCTSGTFRWRKVHGLDGKELCAVHAPRGMGAVAGQQPG